MPSRTRRTFLKVSGSLLGGIAMGSSVIVAASTNRFLVDTKAAPRAKVKAADLDIVHDLDEIDLLVVEGAEADVRSLNARYAPDSTYSLNRPLSEHTPITASAIDEPKYGYQWDKQAQSIPEAHETTRGEGTRVTVIDTGVAAGHPDLAHTVNEDLSRNFTADDYGAGGPYGGYHGTHVAGIIAANDQNEEGVVGTAPGTEVVDCRVFSPDELASFADILAAIVYSVRIDADAANMSIGAYPVSRERLGQFYGMALNRVTTYANSHGTLLIAAAGNDSANLQHDGRICGDFDDNGTDECISAISLPNEAANVMSVSATGPIGYQWGDEGLVEDFDSPTVYTNYGTNAINIAAPGGDADLGAIGTGVPWYRDLVYNTIAEPMFDDDDYQGADYDYGWAAGTSMACPQVVGAAALVKSQNPEFNANQVRQTLENTAESIEEYDKTYYGAGFLNPAAAVDQ
ncbi:S8 family serine peptidase [Natrinema sp. 1APR25-10V2]|uniref:S8 family peptidase n=1 Tax=Natrinema sp. 1APR25-10V2 TaxID=2951081 RepID=UPI00287610A7|nr:S8 family serine peptidase [Natrinema sp. 1APR25-10V2]